MRAHEGERDVLRQASGVGNPRLEGPDAIAGRPQPRQRCLRKAQLIDQVDSPRLAIEVEEAGGRGVRHLRDAYPA
jgi:hypothetical protein